MPDQTEPMRFIKGLSTLVKSLLIGLLIVIGLWLVGFLFVIGQEAISGTIFEIILVGVAIAVVIVFSLYVNMLIKKRR